VLVHNPHRGNVPEQVLRPILKLQNDLFVLLSIIRRKYKGDFYAQTTERRWLPLKMQFKRHKIPKRIKGNSDRLFT
jgi:hypothetical protein